MIVSPLFATISDEPDLRTGPGAAPTLLSFTTAQRNALTGVPPGAQIWNTDTKTRDQWSGTAWASVATGASMVLFQTVDTGGVLSGAGSPDDLFFFRAMVALNMGISSITMLGGSWTANDAAYWNINFVKNGSGAGGKTLQTTGAGGTGSIAQDQTVQLQGAGFFQCAAGDTYTLRISPIGGPADLPRCVIAIALTPA